jgi:hypothetical protein
VKAILEARWNPVKKIWTVPIAQQHFVETLHKKYGAKEIQQRAEEYDVIPPLPDLNVEIPLKKNTISFPGKRRCARINL